MQTKIKALVERYRLPTFLLVTMLIATVMVFISMYAYHISGAAQLDLSRPEYTPVRSQIDANSKASDGFSAQGPITDEVLEDFLTQYKEQATKILEADAFANDVLSDEQLGI